MKKYNYTINGKKYEVSIGAIEDNVADVTVNGEQYKVEMEAEAKPEKPKVKVHPVEQKVEAAAPATGAKASYQNAVKAPLPGVITEITVAVGDEVKAGDTVVVLEAMKMANNLEAEKAGKDNVTEMLPKAGKEDKPTE